MSEFQIVPSVGIWQLNPMNHALKNDYMDNLLELAISILPELYAKFGEVNLIEGFVSKKSLADDELFRNKRCSGNCIIIERYTIPDTELVEKLKDVLSKKSRALSCVFHKDKIFLIRKLNDFSSIERIDNNKSILIWKK